MKIKQPIDCLIVAPLREEIEALRTAFADNEGGEVYPHDDWESYCYRFPTDAGRAVNTLVVKLEHQGVLNAGIDTYQLIWRWKPLIVISFGIAGGFVGEDINLTDVLVPDTVFYYEPAKEAYDENASPQFQHVRLARPIPYDTDNDLVKLCLEHGRSASQGRFGVCRGPVASGEKLIADGDSHTRGAIKGNNDKILGVEMEAAGVAAAIKRIVEFPKPQFLVVKGISDDATKNKGGKNNNETEHEKKQHRLDAAAHAANVLASTISAFNPQFRATAEPTIVSQSRKLRDDIVDRLPEIIVNKKALNKTQLLRTINPSNRPPPVFYHWRILSDNGENIHWVDFCMLLFLRRLNGLGFSIIPLVTEDVPSEAGNSNSVSGPLSDEAKEELDRIVYSVVRTGIHWHSRAMTRSAEHYAYCTFYGLDYDAQKEIERLQFTTGVREGNILSIDWLRFIAWQSRHVERCIIAVWEKHAKQYEQLSHILSLRFANILTKDINLGGNLGKFSEPGKYLVIDPPKFSSILNWLNTQPPSKQVSDFASYISLGEYRFHADVPGVDICADLLSPYPELCDKINKMDSEFANAAAFIVNCISKWNKEYFSDWNK